VVVRGGGNLKNFRSKNKRLNDNLYLIGFLIFTILFQAWHSNKNILLLPKIVCSTVFYKRKFPKLMSKTQVSFVNGAPKLFDCGWQ
jgi:hypothetical protein